MTMENGSTIFGGDVQAGGLACLVLDLNSFFASCEQQDDPALRGRPLIVVPTMAESTSAIAASYPAKKFGIKTGTKVYEARQLCPDLAVVLARHKRYVEYHHQILKAVEACIPIDDVMSIDEVACLLGKSQRNAETAKRLGIAIKQRIRDEVGECMTSSIGIAANKLLAKLASNMQKPDGLTVLETASMPGSIRHLELRDMPGIGYKRAQRLNQAGIYDINALWNAPALQLRAIWGGVGGAKFHALLHGDVITSAKNARASMSHQHVLAPAMRNHAQSAVILRQLLVRLAQRLRDEKFYCTMLLVDVRWQSREEESWGAKHSFKQTQDTSLLLRVFEEIWKTAPHGRPLRVGVTLAGLAPEAAHQPDLFDKPKDAKLISVMDAVNEKFGRGAITYGSLPQSEPMTSKIAFQRVPGLKEL